MTNPEQAQPNPKSQLEFDHFELNPLQVLNATNYTREALAARQKELGDLYQNDPREFYNQIHRGTLIDFSMNPGVRGLRLPTDGDAVAYLSTFDDMRVEIRGKASRVEISLWSSEPSCQQVTCEGCAGCLAPCFTFDAAGSGAPYGVYDIIELQMREKQAPDRQPRVVCRYNKPFEADGDPGWAAEEIASNEQHKHWFETGVQALVDKICTQEIIDFNELLKGEQD